MTATGNALRGLSEPAGVKCIQAETNGNAPWLTTW